jgi:hypothetical protein
MAREKERGPRVAKSGLGQMKPCTTLDNSSNNKTEKMPRKKFLFKGQSLLSPLWSTAKCSMQYSAFEPAQKRKRVVLHCAPMGQEL